MLYQQSCGVREVIPDKEEERKLFELNLFEMQIYGIFMSIKKNPSTIQCKRKWPNFVYPPSSPKNKS